MKDWTIIAIPSHPKYLALVRAVTVKMAELSGIVDGAIEDVKLAVDEACSNIIKHAYRGETDKKIVVKFRIIRKGFEVIIEDKGLKASPELIEGRSLNEVRPGGLGIHLIKRAFDIVAFDEKRKKGNRLILIRFRKK
jgi:anti-sigma regulatory factor (Ser/Thr protein kinase)